MHGLFLFNDLEISGEMKWVILVWFITTTVNGFSGFTFDAIENLTLKGGRHFVEDLCWNLTAMHNEIKIGDMSQTNREFLNLEGEYANLLIEQPGHFIVSRQECEKALNRPKNRKAKKWMKDFIGTHTGTL